MTTGLDLVRKGLQKAGVLTEGETPNASQGSDGLDMLNGMLDSWSNDSLAIYSLVTENFTLTSNDGSYTIGLSQDFNTTRPTNIVNAFVRDGTTDHQLDIISDQQYQQITNKSIQGIPRRIAYDNAYPYGTIKLWPYPSSAYTLYLTSEKPLSNLTFAGVVSFPPGWERAIIYNLAEEFFIEYGLPPRPDVVKIAADSRADILRAVNRNKMLQVQPAGSGLFNINSGYK